MAVVEENSLSSWDLIEEEMDDPGLAHSQQVLEPVLSL